MTPSNADAVADPVVASTNDEAGWFAREVEPCQTQLRSFLRKSLPCVADVDDAAQDCYVRILRARSKGGIRSTKQLLFAIARNAVYDFFSRRRRTEFVPISGSADLPVLAEEAGLVERICREQELALLNEAIDTLPQRCREVLLLRKIKGLSHCEIAEILGISANTVETQVARGMRRCIDYLRAKGLERSRHVP